MWNPRRRGAAIDRHARLSLIQWRTLWFLVPYTFVIGVVEAFHVIDWQTGIFFEVPALVLGRVLWTRFKVGTEGLELSDDPVDAFRDATDALDATMRKATTESGANVESKAPFDEDRKALGQEEGPKTLSSGDIERTFKLAVQTDDALTETVAAEANAFRSERDPVMLFARLRVDLELALRRMAQLAGLIAKDQKGLSPMMLVHKLSAANLIDYRLTQALRRVLRVCNAAVHGEFDPELSSERSEVADLGAQVLNGIRDVATSPSWVGSALVSRARILEQRVVTREMNAGGRLVINNVPFRITGSMSIILRIDFEGVSVLTREPIPGAIESYVREEKAVAWVIGGGFNGTIQARDKAAWLFAPIPSSEKRAP